MLMNFLFHCFHNNLDFSIKIMFNSLFIITLMSSSENVNA